MVAYAQIWDSTKAFQIPEASESAWSGASGTTTPVESYWVMNDYGSLLGGTIMSGYYLIVEASVDDGQTWERSGTRLLNERWVEISLTGVDNTGGAIAAQTTAYTPIGAGRGQLLSDIPQGCGRSFSVRVVYPFGVSEAGILWRIVAEPLNPVIAAADLSDYGVLTVVPYNAANFTAQAGTWTVDAGDQTTLAYTRIGRMLIVYFAINNTDVSATPSYLTIKIPGGFSASVDCRGTYWYRDAAGPAYSVGLYSAVGTELRLYRDPGSTAWSTTAGDNTRVQGTAFILIV